MRDSLGPCSLSRGTLYGLLLETNTLTSRELFQRMHPLVRYNLQLSDRSLGVQGCVHFTSRPTPDNDRLSGPFKLLSGLGHTGTIKILVPHLLTTLY
jgi:hypothetical protein